MGWNGDLEPEKLGGSLHFTPVINFNARDKRAGPRHIFRVHLGEVHPKPSGYHRPGSICLLPFPVDRVKFSGNLVKKERWGTTRLYCLPLAISLPSENSADKWW